MASAFPVLALAALALLLAWPAPRVLAGRHRLRRCPGATLTLWQVVGLTAVVAALLTAPAVAVALLTPGGTVPTVMDGPTRVTVGLVVALVFSGGMLLRLLGSAHRIGTDLRSRRRQQRHVVDLVADRPGGRVRVLDHPGRSAYCLPGLHSRVVLTRGTVGALAPEELEAVLAHERAHTRSRHDLLLELFTVLHRSVPRWMRSDAAYAEVQLLVELLADRRAAREVGVVPLAGALRAMRGAGHPGATLGSDAARGDVAVRVRALADHARRGSALAVPVLTGAVAVGVCPWLLLLWATSA